MEPLYYQIALTQTEGIGNKTARNLLSKFGSAKAVFEAKEKDLATVGGLGKERIFSLKKEIENTQIEKELSFIQKHQIQPLFLSDKNYPKLLKECPDAPILLYFKGNYDFNTKRRIAIIGTRTHTDYGRQMTEEFVAGFKGQKDLVIVSGLAHGIDSIAHKAALKNDLSTIGVLAHGLDRIYPSVNKDLSEKMMLQGGLLTEYPSGTIPDKQNFPQRNRIVAGMSDVTVVVETGIKGGAMITAKLACSYDREVAAFPGKVIDNRSAGCNYLIQTHIAHLISNAEDLMILMDWESTKEQSLAIQRKLFETLEPIEQKVMDVLEKGKEIHIDELTLKTGLSDTKMAALLLTLELDGWVRSLPGKRYRLS